MFNSILTTAATARSVMRVLKRADPQTLGYVVLSFLTRISNVAAIVFAVSVSTASTFGTFTFAQATANLVVFLISLNMTTSINVVLNKSCRDDYQSPLLFLSLYTLFCSLTLLPVLVFGSVAASNASHWTLTTAGLTLVLAISSLAQVTFQGYLFGIRRPRIVAEASLLSTALFVVGLMVIRSGTNHVLLAGVISSIIGSLFIVVLSFYHSGVRLPFGLKSAFVQTVSFAVREMRVLFDFGLKSVVAAGMLQFGLWTLQARLLHDRGPYDVAAFGIGTQFYNVVIFLPTMIGPLLLRRFAASQGNAEKIVKIAVGLSSIAGALILVGYEVVAKFSLSLLPQLYVHSEAVIFWSVLASIVLFVKAPISIYYQSRFVVLPEGVSIGAAALVLIIASALFSFDAMEAAMVRFLAHTAQAVVLFGFYWARDRNVACIE